MDPPSTGCEGQQARAESGEEKAAQAAARAALRDGVRTNLAAGLGRVLDGWDPACGPLGACAGPEEKAGALEDALYASCLDSQGLAFLRLTYLEGVRRLEQALPVQDGPFPEDVPALRLLRRLATAADTLARARAAAPEEPEPRECIRRLFVRTLLRCAPPGAQDRPRILELARRIEASCFNAAIQTSKQSEEPPRRHWDSPAFVDIYSTRCGTVAANLDPDGAASRGFGLRLAERLHAPPEAPDALRPEDLGRMSEKELCPASFARERAEIARRASQRVVEKESNLFRCPHCHERRCTYQEVQRRSLDEAPDYLCLCLNAECGRRFTGRS